jgi:hypothetical protein
LELLSIHSALLFVSLIILLLQLFVRQKRTIHIVLAIFCGSIVMFAAKQLGDEQMGVYRFVVGMGACATCNGFWLVARALFRETNAISGKHLIAAGGLGVLLILGQGLGLIQSMAQDELIALQQSRVALYEVVLLYVGSSCMGRMKRIIQSTRTTALSAPSFFRKLLHGGSGLYCSSKICWVA